MDLTYYQTYQWKSCHDESYYCTPIFIFIISGCFSKQSARRRYVSKPYLFEVATAKECQIKCQQRVECEYFQLVGGSNCYLKKASAASVAKPNNCCIFGPKYCNPVKRNDIELSNTVVFI